MRAPLALGLAAAANPEPLLRCPTRHNPASQSAKQHREQYTVRSAVQCRAGQARAGDIAIAACCCNRGFLLQSAGGVICPCVRRSIRSATHRCCICLSSLPPASTRCTLTSAMSSAAAGGTVPEVRGHTSADTQRQPQSPRCTQGFACKGREREACEHAFIARDYC